MQVAYFNDKTDTAPKSRAVAWPDLAKQLCSPAPHRPEKNGPGFTCARYRPGSTRGTAGVESLSAAVLDFDDGTPPEAVLTRLSGLEAVVYSTFRDHPAHRRFRLVLPLAVECPVPQWAALWQAINHACGGCADTNAKDAARLSYLPAQPTDTAAWLAAHDDKEGADLLILFNGEPKQAAPIHQTGAVLSVAEWLERAGIAPTPAHHDDAHSRDATEPLTLTRDQLIEAAQRITLEGCRAVLERPDASEGECWRDCVLLPLRNTAYWHRGRADDLREAFDIASQQLPGDTTGNAAQWEARTKPTGRNPRTMGTFLSACGGSAPTADGFGDALDAPIDRRSHDAFFYYAPAGMFIDRMTRDQWPATSVDSAVKWETRKVLNTDGTEKEVRTPPSKWIKKHRAVHQMSWLPGAGEVADGVVIMEAGEVPSPGNRVFNLYRPPAVIDGDARQAGKWLDHLRAIYPDDADHLCKWMAYHVQQPAGKCNHALVLIGSPGIGKDTMLEPLVHGVGPWNFADIEPGQLVARFNGYRRNKIIRVNEAHDTGDEITRHGMYEAAKVLIAAPPEVLMVDEKHRKEYAIPNKCGVIFTSNHPTDAMYLPADDRRHYVAASKANKEMFTADYWADLWAWYHAGGLGHAVAYLQGLDLATFNPKAPPPLPPAFWTLVSAGEAPEDGDLRDLIAAVGSPLVLTLDDLIEKADSRMYEELRSTAKRRQWQHRLGRAGYLPVRNPGTTDGRWKIDGKNRAVYGQQGGTHAQHCAAISALVKKIREVRDPQHQIF